jgi:transposase
MEQEDGRKLSSAAQHERRRQVIGAYKRGVNRHRIAQAVGLSYTAVRMIVKRYEDQGKRGLDIGPRGRPVSSGRSLSAQQEERIQGMIRDHRPEQLKMDFALWTRAAVMLLMERECGITLHLRSGGKYLKRWGFTPQKPIRRAYEKSPAAVEKWLDATYPEIKQRAQQEDAEIHWTNACGLDRARNKAEAVDDFNRYQSGQDKLDDHRRQLQPPAPDRVL